MSSLTSEYNSPRLRHASSGTFMVQDGMPKGVDPKTIYQNIKSALASEGYRGEVSIKAFGDKNQIKRGDFPDGFSFTHKRNGPEIIYEMVSEECKPISLAKHVCWRKRTPPW